MRKPISTLLYRSFMLALALAGAASCSDDDNPGAPDKWADDDAANGILQPGEYRFIISCDGGGDAAPSSRVSYTAVTSSHFDTGDHIGIFASGTEGQIQNDVIYARKPDTTTGGYKKDDPDYIQVLGAPSAPVASGILDSIPIPAEGESMDYLFTYPMNPSWNLSAVKKELTITVETDQSVKANYENSDFLWCYTPYDSENATQRVNMCHLMANIVVTVDKEMIHPSAPGEVILHSFCTSASKIKLTSMTPGNMKYNADSNSAKNISMYRLGEFDGAVAYSAVVPAWQDISANTPVISLYIKDDENNFVRKNYTLPSKLSLKDGYYYSFTLGDGNNSRAAARAIAAPAHKVVSVPVVEFKD